MRIADITIPMFRPGSIHLPGLLLLLLLAQPLPAQLLHYSVVTDKTHYVQDERVYIVARFENLTDDTVSVRPAIVNPDRGYIEVISAESGKHSELIEKYYYSAYPRIPPRSVLYTTYSIDLIHLRSSMDGAAVFLEPGAWHFNFDIIAEVRGATEEVIQKRPLIHITEKREEQTYVNPRLALFYLNRERSRAESDEYEVPEEFHELMRQPNETPYRNNVVAYYYTHILTTQGGKAARRQDRLREYMTDVYIGGLFRYFAQRPDEVMSIYLWDNTITLLGTQPDFICERALAMPELENTRLGRYVREYACRDKAAGGGK
jgi:hypothetical protein